MWIILVEEISTRALGTGFLVSVGSVYFAQHNLPLKKITGVNFFRLALYAFYLIGEIYKAGFVVIKLVLTGAKVDIVETKTALTNDFLRVVLGASITLTPGTISMDLTEDNIKIIWLRALDAPPVSELQDPGDLIKGELEKRLLKVQK